MKGKETLQAEAVKLKVMYGKVTEFVMQDKEIVELYWQRNQSAILESDKKYGKSLENTSFRILASREDAEECLQDTFLAAWNSMPTDRPEYLGAYLMKIIRNLSIDRYRTKHSGRRYAGETLIYEELDECIPDSGATAFETMEKGALAEIINSFLGGLAKEKRMVFVKRYFCSETIKDISKSMGISEAKIKSMLMRMRKKLAEAIGEGR